MSLYDSGVDRKPPLPQQYIHNTNTNEYEYECQRQEATNEVVIISILPATDGCINEIGCIILSSALHEKESFSFNFGVDGVSFSSQSDYVYTSLQNRIWIINNEYDIQEIINNSFKSINKNIPQPQTIINSSQIFNDYKVEQNTKLSIHNARIGCAHIYSTLQRIALNQLLSPITSIHFINNAPQPMQSVMEPTNDYNQLNPPIIQEVDTTINNVAIGDHINDITTTTHPNDAIDTNTYEPVVEAPPSPPKTEPEPEPAVPVINNDNTVANINNERNGFHSDEAPASTSAAAAESENSNQKNEPDKLEGMVAVEDKVVEEKDSRSISPMAIINNPAQSIPHAPAPMVMDNKPIIKSSWAAAAKFKSSTHQKSPKRRALGVVDHVTDKISFRGGKYGSSKSIEGIRNSIEVAINQKRIIWVSYNGHMKPFIPRAIRPQSWDSRTKQKEVSFFAIQHKSKSQNQQRFYLKNVHKVSDKQFRISNDELQQLKKKNNYNYMHRDNNNNQINNNTQRYKNQRPRTYNQNNQSDK